VIASCSIIVVSRSVRRAKRSANSSGWLRQVSRHHVVAVDTELGRIVGAHLVERVERLRLALLVQESLRSPGNSCSACPGEVLGGQADH
jgi:hypothetical protein